jgi:hypothetical protein
MTTRAAHAALSGHLKAMPDAPPIAYENVLDFKPPPNKDIWLIENILPSGGEWASLGAGHTRYTGIYQVTVSALHGQGSGAAENVADRIIQHFTGKPPSHCLVLAGGVRITRPPTRGPALRDGPRIAMAVSVYFSQDIFRTEQE